MANDDRPTSLFPMPTNRPSAPTSELAAEIARLRAENASLKALQRGLPPSAVRRQHDLTTSFSHDMRTSLNDITGFASILDDEIPGHLNPRQRGYLGKIIGGAEKLLRLVENLVAHDAAETGQLKIVKVSTDYGALLIDASEPLRPMAENKMTRIQVKVEVPGQPLIDRRGITLVIGNLLSNALRQNGLGGMVDVTAHVEGDKIVTSIRDYGPGLTSDELTAIMEPARDGARQGASEFGIALSRTLIEAHGGQMGVDTRSGVGTTFWFWLPYQQTRLRLA